MVAVADTSLARIVAQGLVPLTRGSNPVAAVELLLAVQGQMAGAIPWAIGARCTAVTRAQVAESFQSGELVRSWPMRDTLHVTSARDHHWLGWGSAMLSSRKPRRRRSSCWERTPRV